MKRKKCKSSTRPEEASGRLSGTKPGAAEAAALVCRATIDVVKKPYVICHMFTSVDGRIVLTHWGIGKMATKAYERTAATLNGDAWIIGRVSMEPYAGKTRVPRGKATRRIARK